MSQLYGESHRALQMAFDTRSLADRLEEISTRNASAIVPVGPTDVVPAGANPPPQQPSISNLINQFEANRTSSSSSPKQSTS